MFRPRLPASCRLLGPTSACMQELLQRVHKDGILTHNQPAAARWQRRRAHCKGRKESSKEGGRALQPVHAGLVQRARSASGSIASRGRPRMPTRASACAGNPSHMASTSPLGSTSPQVARCRPAWHAAAGHIVPFSHSMTPAPDSRHAALGRPGGPPHAFNLEAAGTALDELQQEQALQHHGPSALWRCPLRHLPCPRAVHEACSASHACQAAARQTGAHFSNLL